WWCRLWLGASAALYAGAPSAPSSERSQSPPAWRWSNPSIASQDPIDAALVPPLKRSRDVRHTLTALPALPQLSLLFRREPCPCMPLHSHTSSSAKIRRCCVDSLNSPQKQTFALQQFSIRSPRRRARGAWAKAPARHRAGKGWLSGPLYQGFNRLHHRSLWIAKAIISHLLRVLVQEFHFIDGRLTALAVIVAAQPDRDVSRISNL